MKKIFFALILSIAAHQGYAQRVMTLDECMAYAAEHSSQVKLARWDLSEAAVNTAEALANFFPSISAQVGAQYNWGRNIDPETNTYNNVTTFNNGYGLYASLTVFDGGRTINRYKQARARRSRQACAVDMHSDDCAISAMLAYVDAAHYCRAVDIAQDKLSQSQSVLRLTLAQEQLGLKGRPDVAQARAATADDEYNLVKQRNLYSQAMLTLRAAMTMPIEEDLMVDTSFVAYSSLPELYDTQTVYNQAITTNPKALDAQMNVKALEYAYKVAKGSLSPEITLQAGISSSYYKTITGGYPAPSFGDQLRNNRGEYLAATLSIPIFSGLNRISNVKRARIALERAKEEREETFRKLRDDIASAILDRDGYAMEIQSLAAKVKADEDAYRLNERKYQEGMLSLIDLQLSANTYYTSRLNLLHSQMLYILKSKLVQYYKGEKLY